MRLDKCLWAARFYKTRSLAADAVDGGKVRLNEAPVKPAREVKPGDRIRLRAGDQDWEVIIRGLNAQRRPAPEARLLYEETVDSAALRAKAAATASEAGISVPSTMAGIGTMAGALAARERQAGRF